MKLSQCKHGVLVQADNGKIGMVVGITNNVWFSDERTRAEPERAVPRVEWASGQVEPIHPSNIELFKE